MNLSRIVQYMSYYNFDEIKELKVLASKFVIIPVWMVIHSQKASYYECDTSVGRIGLNSFD